MISFENINRNQMKLFAVVGALVIIVVIVLVSVGSKAPVGPSRPPVTLTVWGTGESNADLEDAIKAFKDLYGSVYQSKIDVKYTSWPAETYEETLVDKIAEGKGPDVAMVKGTWMLKHYPKVQPFPEDFGGGYLTRSTSADIGVWTAAAYGQTYVRAATSDFVLQGKIYAVPLTVDTLGLYYNEDLFRQAGIAPSKPGATWQEVDEQIPSLRVASYDLGGGLQRAALAAGATSNIRLHAQRADHASPTVVDDGVDLLSMFILQSGGGYCSNFCTTSALGPEAQDGIARFLRYTTTSAPTYTWSTAFPASLRKQYENDSVDAFIAGDVAMILGYSDVAGEITSRQAGRSFTWHVAPVPQLADADGQVGTRVAMAEVWGLAVTAGSKQKQPALEFVSYMGRQLPQSLHFKATHRPPARQDLLKQAAKDQPELAAIIQQALIAEDVDMYDERIVRPAIARAIEQRLASQDPGEVDVQRLITDAIEDVTGSAARTPPPPKPSLPPAKPQG